MNCKNERNCRDCRTLSKISKKRWHGSNCFNDQLKSSKTVWPVPQIKQIFLPDFKIKSKINEHSFEVICENGVQQVKNEVQIQSVCGHQPFIVSCRFFWQNRNQLFIVSDYIGGGELLKLLHKHGPLPEELCRTYFAELVVIIDFLHNAGVIYRDIKPENILLDDFGHLQLIDFGLSKWLPQGCRTTTICGTTQYMAPEILESESYSHAIDWWSAGILLFQMLTNQFPPKSYDEIKNALKNVSKGATSMVLMLLQTNPQFRLKSLHQIRIQPFFHGVNFSDIMLKKYKPKEIFQKLLGDKNTPSNRDLPHFEDFDS